MAEINLLDRYPRTRRDIKTRHAAQAQERDVAKKFGQEYFDGSRTQGYGGYKYDGRWLPVAETFRDHWKLKSGDRVLDVGCAKGFLMKDLMTVCPGLEVFGIDISEYAINNCHPDVKGRVQVGNAKSLPFPDGYFTAVISINTIHNLDEADCIQAVREIQRVSNGKAYIQVDSYHSEEEKEIFLQWMLTCVTHFYPQGWRDLFKKAGYTGDYYWTIAE
jgi:SAM-dependent methyltransferase